MAASIVSRTFSSVIDQKLSLANDQCGRLIAIGTSWTKIRIGVRWGILTNGLTSNLNAPRLNLGLCSGTTNMAGSQTCTNFFGVMNGTTAVTNNLNLTTGATGLQYFGTATNGFFPCKIVSGVTTSGVTAVYASQNIGAALSATNNPRRDVYVLEITKGSPNYTIQSATATNSLVLDLNSAQMIDAFESSTMTAVAAALATYAGAAYAAQAAQTLAFDEVAGALNAVNLMWSSSSRPLEISDFIYARIA